MWKGNKKKRLKMRLREQLRVYLFQKIYKSIKIDINIDICTYNILTSLPFLSIFRIMYHFYTLLLCFRGYRNETLVWSKLEKFRSDKYYRHLCNGTIFKIRHNIIFIILKGQKRNLYPIDLVALFLSKQALESLIFMKSVLANF